MTCCCTVSQENVEPVALQQTAFFVDSANGNDAFPGSAAFPIQTLRELQLRLEGRRLNDATDTTVTLIGNFSTEVLVIQAIIPAGRTLLVTAAMTTVYSGVIGVFTALNAAANQPAQIQDAGLNAAAEVRRRFRMTNGAASGALAWGLAAVAADTERLSQFTSPTSGASQTPANGNTYVVETYNAIIGGIQCRCLGGGILRIENLQDTSGGNDVHVCNNGATTRTFIVGCDFTGTTQWRDSLITRRSNAYANNFYRFCEMFEQGYASFGVLNTQLACTINITNPACFQGQSMFLGVATFVQHTGPIGFFDLPAAGQASLLELEGSAVLIAPNAGSILWGVANLKTTGVTVRSGAQRIYTTIDTAVGTVNQVLLGGIVTTYAAIAGAALGSIIQGNGAAYVLRA